MLPRDVAENLGISIPTLYCWVLPLKLKTIDYGVIGKLLFERYGTIRPYRIFCLIIMRT